MKRLFMALLGCKPPGRFTEQHDIFFGIGDSLKSLVPDIIYSWPEAHGEIHIDAWREVNYVDQRIIQVAERQDPDDTPQQDQLFFINLGGYKQNEFEEYHYKMLVACADKATAIRQAKSTAFYRHTGFEGASSHIDDRYGVDIDDIYQIEDVLSNEVKQKFRILVSPAAEATEDELHLGYFRLNKI